MPGYHLESRSLISSAFGRKARRSITQYPLSIGIIMDGSLAPFPCYGKSEGMKCQMTKEVPHVHRDLGQYSQVIAQGCHTDCASLLRSEAIRPQIRLIYARVFYTTAAADVDLKHCCRWIMPSRFPAVVADCEFPCMAESKRCDEDR
jgi:hypothetical protein